MVLYNWFMAVHSGGKPMTRPMIIHKLSLYGEMKITIMFTLSDGWLQRKKKEKTVRNEVSTVIV